MEDRKSSVNIFLWTHVIVLVSLLVIFTVVGSIIIKKEGLDTIEKLKNNSAFTYYALTEFGLQVCINLYIAILLSVIQGRTIHFLKKQFGTTF